MILKLKLYRPKPSIRLNPDAYVPVELPKLPPPPPKPPDPPPLVLDPSGQPDDAYLKQVLTPWLPKKPVPAKLRPLRPPTVAPYDPETRRRPDSKIGKALAYVDAGKGNYREAAAHVGLYPAAVYNALKRRAAQEEAICPHCGHIPGTKPHRFVPSAQAPPRPRR